MARTLTGEIARLAPRAAPVIAIGLPVCLLVERGPGAPCCDEGPAWWQPKADADVVRPVLLSLLRSRHPHEVIEQEALTEYQKRTQNGGVSTPGRPRGAKNRRMLQAQEENEQAQEENGVEASPATLGVDSPTEKA